jgi:hypothetical protein
MGQRDLRDCDKDRYRDKLDLDKPADRLAAQAKVFAEGSRFV